MSKQICRRGLFAAGVGVAAAFAAAVLPLSASAGSCIISGETNRVANAALDKPMSGALDSFWRDFGFGLFSCRFRAKCAGIVIIVR